MRVQRLWFHTTAYDAGAHWGDCVHTEQQRDELIDAGADPLEFRPLTANEYIEVYG